MCPLPTAGASPRATIVIPVFNRLDLTKQCLETIRATTAPGLCEIVVVDNASTDGTREYLRAEQEQGRLVAIVNDENVGFGRASNAGAAAGTGETVCLLNNDTVPHAGWLDALLAVVDADPSVGCVGARLLYGDGTIQHAGVTFRTPWRTDHVYRGYPADHPPALESKDYPAVTGACMLLPRTVWEELGGLDEGYRHYVEDVDLCLRVWASGRRVHYCAESVVTHLEQQSAPTREWIEALVDEGWSRFHARWASRWPEPVKALSPVVLPEGTRPFAVVALARDLVESPELLSAYASRFDESDEATLVVFDPELSSEEVGAALGPVLERVGLAEVGPDMLALGGRAVQIDALAGAAQGLLGRSQPRDGLARLPVFDADAIDQLRARAERFWASVG